MDDVPLKSLTDRWRQKKQQSARNAQNQRNFKRILANSQKSARYSQHLVQLPQNCRKYQREQLKKYENHRKPPKHKICPRHQKSARPHPLTL